MPLPSNLTKVALSYSCPHCATFLSKRSSWFMTLELPLLTQIEVKVPWSKLLPATARTSGQFAKIDLLASVVEVRTDKVQAAPESLRRHNHLREMTGLRYVTGYIV